MRRNNNRIIITTNAECIRAIDKERDRERERDQHRRCANAFPKRIEAQ